MTLRKLVIFFVLLLVGVPVLAVLIAIVGGTQARHAERRAPVAQWGDAPLPPRPPAPPEPVIAEAIVHVSGAPRVHLQVEPGPAGVAMATDDGEWFLKLNEPSVARDPHASKQTLNSFVADRVAAACEQVGPGSARRVVAVGSVGDAARAVANAAGAVLDGTPPETRPADETWVKLRREQAGKTAVSWWPEPLERYTLVAEVVGPSGSAIVNAKLDEKPWLETPPSPSSAAGRNFMVVTSGPPAGSKSQALAALRQRVAPTVTEHVFALARARPGAQPSYDDVRRQVESRYGQPASAADNCVVAIDRPYGRVWFAASLLDASRDDLAHLAVAAQTVHTHRKQSFAGMVVALAGMMLVLGVVYAGLNALTRGYFRGQLRTAVVVALVVAVAVVFLLAA